MPGRGTWTSRVGAGFALLGVVAVLGGTFSAGVFVGRYWPRVQVTMGLVKPRADTAATTGPAVAASPERRHVPARTAAPSGPTVEPEKVPSRTFYQELTAPLERPSHATGREATMPTRPMPGAVPSPPPAAVPTPAAPPGVPAPPGTPPPAPAAAERAQPRDERIDRGAGDAFTVQAGAYGSRAAAESLRATLAARGFDAGISTVDTPAGLRYRVRVGTFRSREAATAVMARLTSEANVGAIIMPAGASAHALTERRPGGREDRVAAP